MKSAALFLDRDGVVNRDFGYVGDRSRFEFEDGIFALGRQARSKGYHLIVITNQSGIGRGYFSETAFRGLSGWMADRFVEEQAPLTALYYCPCHPESALREHRRDCDCRKPRPGLFQRALDDWNLDPIHSIVLGDRMRDLEAGRAAGVATGFLYRKTGSGPAPDVPRENQLTALTDLTLPPLPATAALTDAPETCRIVSCREISCPSAH